MDIAEYFLLLIGMLAKLLSHGYGWCGYTLFTGDMDRMADGKHIPLPRKTGNGSV